MAAGLHWPHDRVGAEDCPLRISRQLVSFVGHNPSLCDEGVNSDQRVGLSLIELESAATIRDGELSDENSRLQKLKPRQRRR